MRLKQYFFILLLTLLVSGFAGMRAAAQCSICTRTAQQLGDRPARGLNAGIMYLAFTPLVLIGVIGYRVFKKGNEA